MSQISERKCPTCGKWSNWTGKIDERCPHCNSHLDPTRYKYAEEQRITAERMYKAGVLDIKDTDDPIIQMFKQFINWLLWTTFYGISIIYVFIAVMIVLYGLVML